jgi:type II secretory pathway component PulF
MAFSPVFVAFPYPYYIKKEDAKYIIKLQKRLVAFVLIVMSIVLGIIQFMVSPRLLTLYVDFKIPVPFIVQISSGVTYGIIIIFFVISTFLLTKEPNNDELNEKLKKYKEGEMIRSNEVVDVKKELVWLIPIFLAVAWLVCSVILPIYNLTNTL